MISSPPYTVALIIPTGIGAAMGGYAGDALPVARAIAHVADRLITHPNVLNGAQLYWPIPNSFYVEGYGLDQFAAGAWGLRPVRQNRIGLVLDQGIEPELQLRHIQVADAARATLGLTLTDYVVTDGPLGVDLRTADSGATWGTIQHPDRLLRAVDKLIHQAGAEAIAVVVRFPDDSGSEALTLYRHGQGVDPLAGAEAVISHLIVRTFQIPCAHAPALQPLPLDPTLSPRSAAEELGYTFLPCVLVGLSRAPQFVVRQSVVGQSVEQSGGKSVEHSPGQQSGHGPVVSDHSLPSADIWANQVDALILPATACGGSAVLSWSQTSTQIIAVAENQTRLQVSAPALGLSVTTVTSYLEAIGLLVAHRAGLSPTALTPHLQPIRAL